MYEFADAIADAFEVVFANLDSLNLHCWWRCGVVVGLSLLLCLYRTRKA